MESLTAIFEFIKSSIELVLAIISISAYLFKKIANSPWGVLLLKKISNIEVKLQFNFLKNFINIPFTYIFKKTANITFGNTVQKNLKISV